MTAEKGRETELAWLEQVMKTGAAVRKEALQEQLADTSAGISWYARETLRNQLRWSDSLNVGRGMALLAQDYLNYRLGKPYKIKPRLVLIQAPADSTVRIREAARSGADFILSFPSVSFAARLGKPCVITRAELYEVKTGQQLWSKTQTGYAEREMTDMPLCGEDGPGCAIANSIYPSLIDALQDIVERFTGQPAER